MKHPNSDKSSVTSELTPAGQIRREEMRVALLEKMSLQHARRKNRKQVLKLLTLVLVLASSFSWMIWKNMRPHSEPHQWAAGLNRSDRSFAPKTSESDPMSSGVMNPNEMKADIEKSGSSDSEKTETGYSLTNRTKTGLPAKTYGNENSINPYPTKHTAIDRYVVSTSQIQTRTMETINDNEMLELLKQAGVQGWIAEIGEERVVLDGNGKRL